MAPPIEVVAIITPKEGKIDRVVELLTNLASAVEKKEHGCLKYNLHRQIKNVSANPGEEGRLGEELVMIETYKDKASYEVHHNSEDFKSLVGAVQKEDLLAKGLEIMYLEPIGGFASRL